MLVLAGRSEHSWFEYRRQAFEGFAYDAEVNTRQAAGAACPRTHRALCICLTRPSAFVVLRLLFLVSGIKHHLEPYVTYLPAEMEVAAAASPETEAGAHDGGEEGGEQGEGGESDEDDAGDAYTWFGAKPPGHPRLLEEDVPPPPLAFNSDSAAPARAFDSASAATYIQKLYRARLAKKAVRKALCKTWCKKADTTPVSTHTRTPSRHHLSLCAPGLFHPFFLCALKVNLLARSRTRRTGHLLLRKQRHGRDALGAAAPHAAAVPKAALVAAGTIRRT